MALSVVLLRAVNVGTTNRVAMGDFRAVLESLGATDVRTYVQSGNAVVDLPAAGLADRVEAALAQDLDLHVRAVVVSAANFAAIVRANPWPERAAQPKQLHVVFCSEQADVQLVKTLGTKHGADEFAVGRKVLYVAYSDASHNSPLVPVLKKINGVTTARNWLTVMALHDMCT